MATLYVRDVPEDVARTLKERAAGQGMSLSAYVVAELGRVTARPTNTELAERLRRVDRSGGPTRSDIVDALGDARR